MMRQIVLLRGVNLGPRNRIPMAELRELLAGAGLEGVQTYVQSGNVVVSSDLSPERLARRCHGLVSERFGLDIDVVVRTRDELAEVVRRNPLGRVAVEPKRHQVTFLASEPDPEAVRRIAGLAAGEERFLARGRELYAWHPAGVGRSRLAAALAGRGVGVPATARNWTTVTKLLELADQ